MVPRLLALACLLACAACESSEPDAGRDATDAVSSGSDAVDSAVAADSAPDAGADAPETDAATPTTATTDATDATTATDAATADGAPASNGGSFLALTEGQLRELKPEYLDHDLETLHIYLSNRALTCRDPFKLQPHCGSWNVSFMLPPALQTPGTWPASDPRLSMTTTSTGPERDQPNCGASYGNAFRGELTVLEVSEHALVVKLTDVYSLDADVNGTYTVSRCR